MLKAPYAANVRQPRMPHRRVATVGWEYPDGSVIERHQHDLGQLIYAARGIIRVDTPNGIWVVPPTRAIWVPRGIEHELRTLSVACLRAIFIQPTLRESLPHECCVIEMSPLLRELVQRVVELDRTGHLHRVSVHLVELLLDEIHETTVLPLHIPMPSDGRVLKICRGVLENPADGRTCGQWGATVGASPRTLERLFHREVGVPFGVWRRQVRLLAALGRLAAATPVATVAFDLGYESASAFTAMFRRTLGSAPSQFFPQAASEPARLCRNRDE